MKKNYLILIMLVAMISLSGLLKAQVSINLDGSLPNSSAMLDVTSADRGILIPRLTTIQRTAIPGPPDGLLLYDTDTQSFWYVKDSEWTEIGSGGSITGSGSPGQVAFWGTAGMMTGDSSFIWDNENKSLEISNGTVSTFKVQSPAIATGEGNLIAGDGAGTSLTTGNNNTVLGDSALFHNFSGSNNNAIGCKTLFSNTYGWQNIAIGNLSLYKNIDGYANTAIGYGAIYNNIDGHNNTAVGFNSLVLNEGSFNSAFGNNSLLNNTYGAFNTASGSHSLQNNEMGNDNTASGFAALYMNDEGGQNSAFGSYALTNNTSGVKNSSLGYNSLGSNKTGNKNCAFGITALNSNTTGNSNVAIGAAALYTNNASDLVAVGDSAMFHNTSGSNNCAIGSKALFSNTYGWSNIAIGSSTLFKNTEGYSNIAIGQGSCYKNINGHNNTGVGFNSLALNEGSFNTAFGNNSLLNNTSGNFNTTSGSHSLQNNETGNDNTASGFAALYMNDEGGQNSAFGSYALTNISTGSNNTAIGYNAYSSGNFSNSTAIGANTVITASNQVRIGDNNVTNVYCEGILADVTSAPPNITIDENGRIRKSTGSSGLTGSGDEGQLAFWDGTGAISGDNSLIWDNENKNMEISNGTVSIGTSSPSSSALLDLVSANKGFLPPRMTNTEMNAVSSPAEGLMVYNTSVHGLCVYNGSNWDCMDSQSLFNKTFSCGDVLRDFRDNQNYLTVQIGTQCWMAENLNIGTVINGLSNQTNNATIEKYCCDNINSNCDTYGGLYQWNEMMQYTTTPGTQGICPVGWHLPTDGEWMTLEEEVESMTGVDWTLTGWRGIDAGGNLKETGTTHWNSPNTSATNSSGFTGIPGAFRDNYGSFYTTGSYGDYWTSSADGTGAWYRGLYYNNAQVGRYNPGTLAYGFSVRCLLD
jgi:trimeric autotransporter adhesin